MAKNSLDQLKADVGLLKLKECSAEEKRRFAEMLKNGQPLPEDIFQAEGTFFRGTLQANSDMEELFVLMRISKDLHFIKVLFQVLLVLSIVLIFLNIFIH